MDKVLEIIMYVLWAATLIGVLAMTFTRFEYADVNIAVGVLLLFAIVNSIFSLAKSRYE